MNSRRRGSLCVLLLALAFASAATQVCAEAPPPSHENVAYGPHERNVLDLWLAKSDQPAPLLIFMHGGGFRRGDKEGVRGRPAIQQCLDAGVSFASINYRFLEHAGLPEILRDAARSIQFLRANAQRWNLDPERIAIHGSSAGAGTSMWLAFHEDLADAKSGDPVLRESSRVTAAGSIDGQVSYDLREWSKYLGEAPYQRTGAEILAFYGFKSEADSKTPEADRVMRDCAMIHLISSDDPPVAIACSRPDTPSADRGHYLHHPKHSTALAEECKQHGVECLLVLDKDTPDREKQAEAVVGFLIGKLKAR